jgi:hypothetical protein
MIDDRDGGVGHRAHGHEDGLGVVAAVRRHEAIRPAGQLAPGPCRGRIGATRPVKPRCACVPSCSCPGSGRRRS